MMKLLIVENTQANVRFTVTVGGISVGWTIYGSI
jgi:hypothetical protein